jgi:uncharacterized protein (TIGR02270 family)
MPAPISKTDAEVFERYADEAAFLWQQRDAAVRDPLHDLASVCALDERLAAQLDGLQLAGDAGWEICAARLEDGKAGEVFAAAAVAVLARDLPRIAHVLDAAGDDPKRARAVVSALGWAPFDIVGPMLRGLLFPRCGPALHRVGIAAGAAHRCDVGAALDNALYSSDARLRGTALRAAGELGRVDLLPVVTEALEDTEERCRFSSAWTAALFGEQKAIGVLRAFAEGDGPHATAAADMAVRRMDTARAAEWLREQARSATPRLALAGAAALGDPATVPWVLDAMEAPENARFAGATLARITGVDLAAEKLKTRAPEGFRSGPTDDPDDDDVAMDPDTGLAWPDVAAVRAWWERRRSDFRSGTRYLGGHPMTIDWLGEVLRHGNQPARASAAIEIAIRQRGDVVFEVRAAGERQRQALGS